MIKPRDASKFNAKGFNCAESIIMAYNEEFGTNIPPRLTTGFGGGLCVGSVCGAVNAAILIIGYEKGRNSEDEENIIKPYVEKFIEAVNERYQHHMCEIIKVDALMCREIIDFCYETLKIVLEK